MGKDLTNSTLGAITSETTRAQEYIEAARAENTVKAYRSDWQHFTAWCGERGANPLPALPAVIACYVSDMAGKGFKTSTITRRAVAIGQAHQLAGHDSPMLSKEVRSVMKGIRRVHGSAQKGKAPAGIGEIRVMVGTLPDSFLGVRDRALLLIGFSGAFRRSELVGLDVSDLETVREGIKVTIRHSKTDQEGHGRLVGIPYGSNLDTCPVRALQAWLKESAITEGPIFREVDRHGRLHDGRLTSQVVAKVVKRTAEKAGLDPARFAGHSLRSGLATSAAEAGVEERDIANQTGHRSVSMLRRYIKEGSLFRSNAAGKVGL